MNRDPPIFRLSDLAELGALALRRQVNDLFALLELPAAWRGLEPAEISRSVLDVLVALLRLDVALLWIHGPDGMKLEQGFPADLDRQALLFVGQEASPDSPGLFALPRPNTVGRSTVRVVSVLPLGEQGRVIAGSWRENFPTAHERHLLQAIVNQAALAMQSSREARARRKLSEARLEAEARQQRADLLSEASALLGLARDHGEALLQVAHLLVPRFAEWIVMQVQQRTPSGIDETQTVVVHREPAKVELVRELGLSLLSTGREARACVTNNSVIAPISARGRTLGAIVLGCEEVGRYGTETLELLVELGLRVGVALDNARLYQEAREADRRKDEFLAMLGHELRNPLSPIVTALHLMKLKGGGDFERERTLIERQVEHLVRLVDDLLDVSRITRGKLQLKRERIDLMGVLTQAVEMASPLLEQRSHHLELPEVREPLLVDGDPARLAQVLANLLGNAAKYTEPGGRIRVTATRVGEQIALAVRDNGAGIGPEVLPRIFDMFVQEGRAIDRSQGGLGLGLAIVRSLVELHGGTVSAHSDGLGRGSEFVVRLPLAAPSPLALGEHPRGLPEGSAQETAQAVRLLIVDDNRDAAELLTELLEAKGYVTRMAHDGPAGLEAASAFRPHIALLDVGLPAMDGYELASRLRREPTLQGLKLVAITGYGQDSDRRQAQAAGFDVHLVKPVDPSALLRLLRELASGSEAESRVAQARPASS